MQDCRRHRIRWARQAPGQETTIYRKRLYIQPSEISDEETRVEGAKGSDDKERKEKIYRSDVRQKIWESDQAHFGGIGQRKLNMKLIS